MSIRLLQSIFIAGVLSPVDGSTLSLSAALEADLVNQGKAVWVSPPALPANNYDRIGGTLTWAQLSALSAAAYAGMQVYVSDVGVGGSFWYSVGDKWRPVGGRVTIKNTISPVTNNGAPKVILDYATLPAGLVADGDVLDVWYHKERTGGTADTDATDIMHGYELVVGTCVSTGLTTSGLATTNITLTNHCRLRKESATSLRPLTIGGGTGLGASTSAFPAAAVANMDSGKTYLVVTSDLTTAGGEVSVLRGFTVDLICGS